MHVQSRPSRIADRHVIPSLYVFINKRTIFLSLRSRRFTLFFSYTPFSSSPFLPTPTLCFSVSLDYPHPPTFLVLHTHHFLLRYFWLPFFLCRIFFSFSLSLSLFTFCTHYIHLEKRRRPACHISFHGVY